MSTTAATARLLQVIVGTLLTAAIPVLATSAQTTELPPLLMVSLSEPSDGYVDRFDYPLDPPAGFVRCYVTLVNTTANLVSLHWTYQAPGATIQRTKQDHLLSFHPTAVAVRASETDTIYVVGWSDRNARVVVERWHVVEPLDVGTVTPAQGGTPVSVLIGGAPSVRRTVLMSSSLTSPINAVSGAACSSYAEKLYMLTHSQPPMIYSLDLNAPAGPWDDEWFAGGWFQPVLVISEPTFAGMETAVSLRAGRHTTKGHVIVVKTYPPWAPPSDPMGTGGQATAENRIVMEDHDLDGTIDAILELPGSTFGTHYLGGDWIQDDGN